MRVQLSLQVASEDKQEERTIITEGEPPELPSRPLVDDIHVLVARPISRNLERSDRVAEVLLVLLLRTERQSTNGRVKAISADQQVKTPLFTAFKRDAQAGFILDNAVDAIVKYHLATVDRFRKDHSREVTSL